MGGSWTMHMYEMDETNATRGKLIQQITYPAPARLRNAQTELGNARAAEPHISTTRVWLMVPVALPRHSCNRDPGIAAHDDRCKGLRVLAGQRQQRTHHAPPHQDNREQHRCVCTERRTGR